MRGEFLWSVFITMAFVAMGIHFRRRWTRMRACYVQLEEYADVLLQHGQGMILNVQAIVSDLSSSHPVRVRVEDALARAERDLSELRETMQPHCSEPQQDRIQ
jgi:hypothetical protein